MTLVVFHKLLAIFVTVALGYVAGRLNWLGAGTQSKDPSRVLSNSAFYVFVPALLFRTTVRLDFATMPWGTVAAYFVPVIGCVLLVYALQWLGGAARRHGPAAPAARAISAGFGNSVQLGIPLAAALFGEAGLAIHIALVSLHALLLLSVLTTLVEIDLARAHALGRTDRGGGLWPMLRTTARNTLIHPVVLPIVAGLCWNATGFGLHPVLDEVLIGLGSAVVPVCLVLIGMSLAYYGLQGRWRGAALLAAVKLLLVPAVALAVATLVFGLSGLPLAVVVMMAALPTGSNALIFAQRYETLKAEATAAIVFSTVAFVATASLWLGVLAWLAR